jgi:hypothetical protein
MRTYQLILYEHVDQSPFEAIGTAQVTQRGCVDNNSCRGNLNSCDPTGGGRGDYHTQCQYRMLVNRRPVTVLPENAENNAIGIRRLRRPGTG